jgi:hypothetical protein
MVIFGAGASYDSCSSFPPENNQWKRHNLWHRPPLAKELFLPVDRFRVISRKYSRFQGLLSELEGKENVEEILERLRVESENDQERERQLLAIKFYLRELINLSTSQWLDRTHGVSNYQALLDQVRTYPRVCFVTFNYDTLIEGALGIIDMPVRSIEDYISHSISLFKLHGSVDWWQAVPREDADLYKIDNPTDQDIIRAAPTGEYRYPIEMSANRPTDRNRVYLPALAIPTVSKLSFVCPPEHVERLKNLIPEVTRIAIVGWRAGEKHFLELLSDGLQRPVKVIAACGNRKAAAETLDRFGAARIITDSVISTDGGFTDFVVNRRIEPFLA